MGSSTSTGRGALAVTRLGLIDYLQAWDLQKELAEQRQLDLIRDTHGNYLVLEDNGRTPSGVSYVLKNREVMKQVFSFLFHNYNVRSIDDYPANLLAMVNIPHYDQEPVELTNRSKPSSALSRRGPRRRPKRWSISLPV